MNTVYTVFIIKIAHVIDNIGYSAQCSSIYIVSM